MARSEFSLIDAARAKNNLPRLQLCNAHNTSLYRGRSEEALADFAPYLFSFQSKTDFSKLYFEKGWGDAWGILLLSDTTFEELYKHFRKFLIVKTEEGKELYFRFYDPRVLRIFLPTCNKEQLKDFFGPVKQFFTEDADANYGIRWWLENAEIKSERFAVKDWNFYEGMPLQKMTATETTNQPIAIEQKTILPNTANNKNSWID